VTGEAQGISEQDGPIEVNLGGRFIGWSNEPVAGAMLALGLEVTRLSAALADRDRELAELRATIAEVEHLVRDAPYFRAETPPALAATLTGHTVGGCECPRCVVIRAGLAALASSGSAPTGQEES
jgi:hypothetical protein